MSDYIVFYMKIACTITQWLHDVLPIKFHVYYMVLHVPAFITWTLHVNLHVWLQIILHVILHPNYMVITYILHDISKKIRSIKPGPDDTCANPRNLFRPFHAPHPLEIPLNWRYTKKCNKKKIFPNFTKNINNFKKFKTLIKLYFF